MARKQWNIALAILGVVALVALVAPAGVLAQDDLGSRNGWRVGGYVDENGDGFNDLAPDADGDGIPNGLDPDYQRPLDGTGQRFGATQGEEDPALAGGEEGYLHMLLYKWQRMWQRMFGGSENGTPSGYGPGDGTGFGGDGPGDGTGFGPGDGSCDGPIGLQRLGYRHGGGDGGSGGSGSGGGR